MRALTLRTACIASVVWVLLGSSITSGENSFPSGQPLVTFGRALFFDASLSADGRVSCATCHRPERAYSDGGSVGRGAWGRVGTRNVPTLLDVDDHGAFNWDGRTATLEEQVLAPYTTAVEHGLSDLGELLQRVSENPAYGTLIKDAFGGEHSAARISEAEIARGLVAFVRSLSGNRAARPDSAASATPVIPVEVARGRSLFVGTAGCATCHRVDESGTPTTDDEYHALGLELASMDEPLIAVLHRHQHQRGRVAGDAILGDRNLAALGRFNATGNPQDIGKFRTPSLRHAAATAPYFHDGGVTTLEEAVDLELYYRRNVAASLPAISREERDDLISFIRWIGVERR